MASPERGPVAGVLLAAGSSTRMGRNKLLLPLGNETLVRRSARAALEAGLDPLIVVLGHDAERVRAELLGLPCVPVVNPEHSQGVGTSLRAGVAHTPTGSEAVVVVLADMPFVTASSIRALVECYRATGAPVVISRYGEVDAPPTLYGRSLFPELLAVSGGKCGKQVARRHAHAAVVISRPAESLRDIDVAEDYEQVRTELAGA